MKACAIGLYWNVSVPDTDMKRDTALFTYCMFKNREYIDIHDLAQHCAQLDLLDEWTQIDICQAGDEGNTFYQYMANWTSGVTNDLVNGMTVQINGVIARNAQNNLVEAVCNAYTPLDVSKFK